MAIKKNCNFVDTENVVKSDADDPTAAIYVYNNYDHCYDTAYDTGPTTFTDYGGNIDSGTVALVDAFESVVYSGTPSLIDYGASDFKPKVDLNAGIAPEASVPEDTSTPPYYVGALLPDVENNGFYGINNVARKRKKDIVINIIRRENNL